MILLVPIGFTLLICLFCDTYETKQKAITLLPVVNTV